MTRQVEDHNDRLTRNLNELLQEIRVGQAGVQILFGFLLSIAFTARYAEAGGAVRAIHLITVMFAAAAVALLTAPAAWHRILFRQGRRQELVAAADRMALVGLACLAIAMTGTIVVLAAVVAGAMWAIVLGGLAAVIFGALWFVLPRRHRRDRELLPPPDEFR